MACVRLGIETDTYDADGTFVATGDASMLTRGALERALGGFTGEIEQTPPKYSALKVAGKPLYRYAREGVDVPMQARLVHVEAIDLLRFDQEAHEAEIRVVCGKGTYIRSIAHDLGRDLGCGAHLSALRRTSSGGFGIDDAILPEPLAEMAAAGRLDDVLLAPIGRSSGVLRRCSETERRRMCGQDATCASPPRAASTCAARTPRTAISSGCCGFGARAHGTLRRCFREAKRPYSGLFP